MSGFQWCLGIMKEVDESDTSSQDCDAGERMVEGCLGTK